jgi:hypothetical protein
MVTRDRDDSRDAPASRSHTRPDGVSDSLVEAVGKAGEALEYIERARGHLYSLHQLIGRADFLFEEAAELLRTSGEDEAARRFEVDIVGRNVLDGRWTFQVVEEFDDTYYRHVTDAVRTLERDHLGGRRHVWEAEMKERRRSTGRPGHEQRPPTAHSRLVETSRNGDAADVSEV